jgi:clan AA aspartic protease
MKGKVNARREALLRLRLEGSDGRRRVVEGIVDTGYDGALTLPPKLVRALKLPLVGQNHAELANGQIVLFNTYQATVRWMGRRVRISVDEAHTDPLIGMDLLNGFALYVAVTTGGDVAVSSLPG